MNCVLERPKYLKKVVTETPFVQPVLTSNGTIGGDSFAVEKVGSSYNGDAYQTFDGSTSTAFRPYVNNGLIFYNPKPINITNLACNVAYSNEGIIKGELYASNDNITWELINDNIGGAQTWSTDISMQGSYKYFKLMSTSVTGARGSVAELIITATEYTETWQSCTKEEYERYKETSGSKQINQKNNIETTKYLQETETTETVTDYVSEKSPSIAISDLTKLTQAQAENIINNNSVTGLGSGDYSVVYTFSDSICINSLTFLTGASGMSQMPVRSISIETYNNGSWVEIISGSYSGDYTYNVETTLLATSNIFTNKIRLNFTGWTYTGGGISYYASFHKFVLNADVKKIIQSGLVPLPHDIKVPKYLKQISVTAFDEIYILSGNAEITSDKRLIHKADTAASTASGLRFTKRMLTSAEDTGKSITAVFRWKSPSSFNTNFHDYIFACGRGATGGPYPLNFRLYNGYLYGGGGNGSDSYVSIGSTLATSTWYWLKFVYTKIGTSSAWTAYYCLDNGYEPSDEEYTQLLTTNRNWTPLGASSSYPDCDYIRLGIHYTDAGSIGETEYDLTKSYIKVGDEYIYRGEYTDVSYQSGTKGDYDLIK